MGRALTGAGYVVDGTPPRPEFRYWRWLAPLPKGRMAFFADHPEAVERLSRERALLDLLGRRLSFAVPTIEYASPDGRLQVRRMVEGVTSFGGNARERAFAVSPAGRRFARELGSALAELHSGVTLVEAEALGVPARGPFPPAVDLRRRLSDRLPEPALKPVLDAVLDGYAAMDEEAGRVLTHGDPWAGNLAIDAGTGRLIGMFDFADAALDDRHADFRYLHSFGERYAERVLDAYAATSGVRPSIRRAALYHMLAAFEALSEAAATGDPEKVAYRLGWVRDALARAPGRLLGLPVARSKAMSRAKTRISNSNTTERPDGRAGRRPRRLDGAPRPADRSS
jgi:aminoglycoside phosphotransferase (APT) family kinase protein